MNIMKLLFGRQVLNKTDTNIKYYFDKMHNKIDNNIYICKQVQQVSLYIYKKYPLKIRSQHKNIKELMNYINYRQVPNN